MGIKFNCSNPECRQRVEVEDALAGGLIPCPACGTALIIPRSHDIHFTCTNQNCRQHIVVDVSEAGRVTKCPTCGKVLRVPGDRAKPMIAAAVPVSAVKQETARSYLPDFSGLRPLQRLLLGWGAGAALFGTVLLISHFHIQAALPSHFDAMADEIYRHKGTNYQSRFSRMVAPVVQTGTNESGGTFEWYLVPPATVEAGRKYPVLVDETSSAKDNHPRDMQFLANCGIFYVSPNSPGITKWGVVPEPQNVRAVYAELLKNPNVDLKRIYICGHSITTVHTCALVDENPALWRGVILLEAVRYPQIPADVKRFPSVFVSIGLADRYNNGFVNPGDGEKWLRQASARFIPARINYQPGGHGYQPPQLQAAYMAAVKFILTDY